MLIPVVGINLLLFSYPSPGFSIITCPRTNFFLKLWNLCDPSANPVRLIKFDLVNASFWLLASLIVVWLTFDTKYIDSSTSLWSGLFWVPVVVIPALAIPIEPVPKVL